jgi:hypothetical protein
MTDEATQATAENLRADFLNATTTHQRWKVLNQAIEWAVAASENARAARSAPERTPEDTSRVWKAGFAEGARACALKVGTLDVSGYARRNISLAIATHLMEWASQDHEAAHTPRPAPEIPRVGTMVHWFGERPQYLQHWEVEYGGISGTRTTIRLVSGMGDTSA